MNDELNIPPDPETSPSMNQEEDSSDLKNRCDLRRGVGIFIVVNGLMYFFALAKDDFNLSFALGWIAMVVNLILLIVFARYRKGIAGGILGAFALLLFLTFIIAPIFWLAVCFGSISF